MDRDWFKSQNSNQVLVTALRLPSPFYSGAPADVVVWTAMFLPFYCGHSKPFAVIKLYASPSMGN